MDKTEFIKKLQEIGTDGKSVNELYNEISLLAMEYGTSDLSDPADKNAYYLSMEFLIGRSFF